MQSMGYYKLKYSTGVGDKSNTLQDYDRFLANSGEQFSLEDFVSHQLLHTRCVRILDIGCGNAGALKGLRKQFGHRVHTMGLDLIDFDLATNKIDQKIIGDARTIALPKNLDLALSFRALHEIGNMPIVLPQITKSLSPSGIALLSVRVHDVTSKKSFFSGSITKKDEAFLMDIGKQDEWMNCTVVARQGQAQEPFNPEKFVTTGIFLKLVKKEA